MLVSNDGEVWVKRRVFKEKNGKYLAWLYVDSEKAVESCVATQAWKYAKEFPKVIELTKEEIAQRLGLDVKYFKIKE